MPAFAPLAAAPDVRMNGYARPRDFDPHEKEELVQLLVQAMGMSDSRLPSTFRIRDTNSPSCRNPSDS